jgi:hypothetical protein
MVCWLRTGCVEKERTAVLKTGVGSVAGLQREVVLLGKKVGEVRLSVADWLS